MTGHAIFGQCGIIKEIKSGVRMKANREQQEIIDDRNKNILLYASAGTGKTFAVAQKVAAEIRDGIAPQEILCLTFTIKACEEIAQELARYGVTDGVTVKTIHGFCLSLIEEEAKGASCKYSEPTVIDESDEEEILQRLVSEILTRSELSEWIRSNKIADSVSELVKKDVVYLPPVGFFGKSNETERRCIATVGECANGKKRSSRFFRRLRRRR